MVVGPGIQIKAVEGDTLAADRNFSDIGADLGVEPVAVHAEVARCIPQSQQPRLQRTGGDLVSH